MTKKRSFLKVLPLEKWMEHSTHPISDDYTPMKPLYGRDGYYLYRPGDKRPRICWFEVAGEAFKCRDSRDFEYRLSLESHRPLRLAEVMALLAVKRHRLLSKSQKDLLYLDKCWKDHRQVWREARMSCIGMVKRLTKKRGAKK